MKSKLFCALVMGLYLATSMAWADSLELKNGSMIKGKFVGATESQISFKVGSSVQQYSISDIVSIKFDSERAAGEMPTRPSAPPALAAPMTNQPGTATG